MATASSRSTKVWRRIAGDWMAAHGLSVEDALIGATAARRRLALVTRNTRDFARLRLDLVDPAQG
jgi:predicted nucleic acid-binding protein